MTKNSGHILVVDDNKLNRKLLTRALKEQGLTSATAQNGKQALEMLSAEDFDVVLLDILMPMMDGYETLSRIKLDERLRHIPVLVISAVEEMESVLRCIEMGATDYLMKPFKANLLRSRLKASLAQKRLRDLELEYLEQVGHVMSAAAAVEEDTFELSSLDGVALREDALGQLARVFCQMAQEVQARQERLKQQVRELTIEIDQARREKTVAEITDSEYFQSLRNQSDTLRAIMEGSDE
jgi:CheY-like chemotaxis protein